MFTSNTGTRSLWCKRVHLFSASSLGLHDSAFRWRFRNFPSWDMRWRLWWQRHWILLVLMAKMRRWVLIVFLLKFPRSFKVFREKSLLALPSSFLFRSYFWQSSTINHSKESALTTSLYSPGSCLIKFSINSRFFTKIKTKAERSRIPRARGTFLDVKSRSPLTNRLLIFY